MTVLLAGAIAAAAGAVYGAPAEGGRFAAAAGQAALSYYTGSIGC